MTVGQALERAEELRPGSRIALATRQAWLKEADAMLRERFLKQHHRCIRRCGRRPCMG